MSVRVERRLAHGGPALMLTMLLGIALFADRLMSLPATASMAANADYLVRDTGAKMAGVNLLFWGSDCYLLFTVATFLQMKRIEGAAPAWAYVQLVAGACATTAFYFVCVLWQTALYRAGDQSPETARLLQDLGWMMFVLAVPPFQLQIAATGLCILGDRRAEPLYPRWAGWLGVMIALSYFADAPMPFFKEGPFARDGLIGYWHVLVTFGIWIVILYALMLRALARQERDQAAGEPASAQR